ncbi:MAG: hydroxymethylglutaryl-CoA reductase [Candidatus Omnitrophota bacterium]
MKAKNNKLPIGTTRMPHFSNEIAYKRESIDERCSWITENKGVKVTWLRNFFEDPEACRGNIENLIGMVRVPVGIAGPILMNGDRAKGEFLVPMATTEGALVTDYHIGMRVVSRSGGIRAKVLNNVIHISPVFLVKGLNEAQDLIAWIDKNFIEVKRLAEETTKHGKLLQVEKHIFGRRLVLTFKYDAQDAHGMNMINKATDAACKYISEKTNNRYYLRSKYTSVKIAASSNIHKGYGREVFADGVITRECLKLLRTTPEALFEYYSSCLLVGAHSGIMGMTAHIANAIGAIYLACGQDVADVSTSHIGISMCEINEDKDLYVSIYIPNLLVGTVGGGTALPTQRECLEIMECFGNEKADRFAEIIAATCLAGELSVLSSVITNRFVQAHEKLGRNKPGQPI